MVLGGFLERSGSRYRVPSGGVHSDWFGGFRNDFVCWGFHGSSEGITCGMALGVHNRTVFMGNKSLFQ